jgi:hypothetical protein
MQCALKLHSAPDLQSNLAERLARQVLGSEIVNDLRGLKVTAVRPDGDIIAEIDTIGGPAQFIRFHRLNQISVGGNERESLSSMRFPTPQSSDIWVGIVNERELYIALDPAQGHKLVYLDGAPNGLVRRGDILKGAA